MNGYVAHSAHSSACGFEERRAGTNAWHECLFYVRSRCCGLFHDRSRQPRSRRPCAKVWWSVLITQLRSGPRSRRDYRAIAVTDETRLPNSRSRGKHREPVVGRSPTCRVATQDFPTRSSGPAPRGINRNSRFRHIPSHDFRSSETRLYCLKPPAEYRDWRRGIYDKVRGVRWRQNGSI